MLAKIQRYAQLTRAKKEAGDFPNHQRRRLRQV
jgi:hypothetical protein